MRPLRIAGLLFATSMAIACTNHSAVGPSPINSVDPATASASSGGVSGTMSPNLILSATVAFGNPRAGSPFPPLEEHDQSLVHAADNLIPRTVVIDKGGTVTFQTGSIHQIAIYSPGKEPEDIDTSPTIAMPCPDLPPFRINDTNGRIAINGSNPSGCGPRIYTHTFNQPGKYLVICEVLPHFSGGMYGWVVVRDRE